MSDKTRAVLAAAAGAAIGAGIGYLFSSEHGRQLRRELDVLLDEFTTELNDLRGTAHKAADVANDGWRLINETFRSAERSVRDVEPGTRPS